MSRPSIHLPSHFAINLNKANGVWFALHIHNECIYLYSIMCISQPKLASYLSRIKQEEERRVKWPMCAQLNQQKSLLFSFSPWLRLLDFNINNNVWYSGKDSKTFIRLKTNFCVHRHHNIVYGVRFSSYSKTKERETRTPVMYGFW